MKRLIQKWRARRIMRGIVKGISNNLKVMSDESARLDADWKVMTVPERWWELYWHLLHEHLKNDSRWERASHYTHWTVEMWLHNNPTLELKASLYLFILQSRIQRSKRKQ